ncbi:MAG: amino acid permease [Planctomycetota bacterium]
MTDKATPSTKPGLGTFGGVFTPSILTILGIILFMRLGYVVGNAGLKNALVMIVLANAITVLTSFSLSAIATNLKVKGGGDYYLISRTLGVHYGGAIGLVLFMAQSVSIAFYCIGFGEAVSGMIAGSSPHTPQIIAAAATGFLFVFAWLGADWATKLQYLIMAILAASMFSFFSGGFSEFDAGILAQNWAERGGTEPFFVLFAIFFPAVTGFTQGVSMSGDLKDPGKSLPLGTFMAVGISIVIYLCAALIFSGARTGVELNINYNAMKEISLIDILIDAGVIAATISSALASFLGAPRILQSLARDQVFPFLRAFAKGVGPAENPRRGVLLSAVIAFCTISLGKLDLIAPIVSMFFLISYGLLNYATYYEARTESPSFRPRFRYYHRSLSLLGSLACLGVMLAIDWRACLVAFSILVAIYQYVRRTAGPSRWADSRRSFHLSQIRQHLLAASAEPAHPRDWRPHLLAFSNDSPRRRELLRFASWIQGNSGFTTAVKIVEGEGLKALKESREAEKELRNDMAAYGVDAFSLAVAAPDLHTGVYQLIQSFGIGPVKANTLLLNWFESSRRDLFEVNELRYNRNLRQAFRLGCNTIILDATEEEWKALATIPGKDRRIDVWWSGDATSRLMLLLAYLITRSKEWHDARIRVLGVDSGRENDLTEESLSHILEEARIDAFPEVPEKVELSTIEEFSKDAGLVFLPLRLKGNHLSGPFDVDLGTYFDVLPVAVMVLAAEDIELDAEPEKGQAGEMAAALDSLADAEKKALAAFVEAGKAAELAEKQKAKLDDAIATSADADAIKALRVVAQQSRLDARKLARRAAKIQAKLDEAKHTTDALSNDPPA